MEINTEKKSLEELESELNTARGAFIVSIKINNAPSTIAFCAEIYSQALKRYEDVRHVILFNKDKAYLTTNNLFCQWALPSTRSID